MYPFNVDNEMLSIIEHQSIHKCDNYLKEDTAIIEKIKNIMLVKPGQINNIRILPKLIQFKIGRCGSTLLNNILENDKRIKIVSEPLIINKIGRTSLSKEKKITLLREAINILSAATNKYQECCFLDLNSQSIKYIDLLQDSFPEAIFTFLYKEPIFVALSLNSKPPMWLKKYSNILEYFLSIISILDKNDIPIFYYDAITTSYIEYIYKQFNIILDNELLNKLNSTTTVYNEKKAVFNYNKVPFSDMIVPLKLKNLLYNDSLITFRLNNPPYNIIEKNLHQIEVFDWNIDTDRVKINDYLESKNRPMLIINGTDYKKYNINLESFDKYNFSYLYTKKENYYVYIQRGEYIHYKQKNKLITEWGDDVIDIDEFKKRKNTYILSSFKAHDNISDNVIHPEFTNSFKEQNPNIRISHKGAVTTSHYDERDSFLIQVKGRKKMILFPPTPNNLKYTYPPEHILSRRFIVNIDNYQQSLYPEFNINDAISVTINEGDSLYFPALWGHYTVSLDESFSISFRDKANAGSLKKNPFPTISESEIQSIEKAQYPNYTQIW